MNVYESNYVRFSRMLQCGESLPDFQRSVTAGDAPLELKVIERAPYTTILEMTYAFEEKGNVTRDPNLVMRLYHDARLLEAEACNDLPRHPALKNLKIDAAGEFARRWQRNILLHKWLEYCIERGHVF